MANHVFYTVVVDGAVIDSHESNGDEQEARAAAIESADALAAGGDQADVYRHEPTGEIGEPAPKHVHMAEGRRAPA